MSSEESVINYWVLCNKLKNLIRKGWVDWHVTRERVESVAEHVYSVQMLAIAMKSEYKYDIDLIHYLFEILNKVCGCLLREAKIVEKDDRYVVITQRMNSLSLTDDQCRLLFTPMTCDIRFLLCKQIIREVGEVTNLRACGIQALRRASTVEIEIIMPKRIWKNLK